nr:hypothetical protein [Tanacetum cinerariifolium]
MARLSFRMFKVNRIEDIGIMHEVQVQLVMRELKTELGMLIQVTQGRLSATIAMENGVNLNEEQLLFITDGQNNVVDNDVDEQPIQDLALNMDNVFQVDDCDTFDFDVDEAPTAQTMFMANLSSADPVYNEAGLSYDSYALSEYVKDNAVQVVQSNVSAIPNDSYMMILNDMHEPPVQHVSVTTHTKTCKKRITPRGLTEGERGFEQTKECYLIEVIPFFKILKEHFEGIQKALTTEIKEMKIIFDALEAEVDQNAVNRKCDEIERKILLIANDTLIANCFSKEVFNIATNSELNVSRFSEMHEAHTVVQARCLELDTELSKLKIRFKKIIMMSWNNREVHLDYLKHIKKSVATLCQIVEQAKVERPLDRSGVDSYTDASGSKLWVL